MTLVGQHIGRYRILEQVGSGGMSVVYRGLDTALEREVAVKVLHPHLASKEDSRRRLTREAKAVAKLQHPNILEVFDFAATDAENAYIVTEYIHGQTLAEYTSRRPLEPPELAAMVIHEVAAALAHAHEAGVIHRDLKPENVMIREDGVIKLTDFGIAKIIDRDDRMTITGALVGSPAHMAPEIIEGQEAGAEADVFSVGTMLYYLSTQQLPFAAPTTTAVLKRILDGSYEDPRSLSAAVSDELTEIIGRCLARDPGSRYPDAGKLRGALAQYLFDLGVGRVSEELSAFFADPDGYRGKLVGRLAGTLEQRAQKWWKEKRPAKALSSLNQVLALDPSHPEAKRLFEEIDYARRRGRARRNRLALAAAVGIAALFLAGGYSAFQRWSRFPDYQPGGGRLTEVQLPAAVYAATTAPAIAQNLAAAASDKGPPATDPEPHARAAAPRPPKAKPVKFTIQFRPYGYARVDGGPPGPELPQHEFDLSPGPHRLLYGCRFCEEKSTVFEVDGQNSLLRLLVQPKPAEVRFSVTPSDAVVSLLGQQRTASESQQRPFQVPFPPGVTQQRLSVQIGHPGFKPKQEVLTLLPNRSQTIQGVLERE